MKPGRELDALVAEKVMGLTFEHNQFNLPNPHEVPFYSTDIAAAWEVISHFNKLGWDITVSSSGELRSDDSWIADFHARYAADSPHWGKFFIAAAYSAPHAVCLAALKAVGVDLK